MGSEHPGSSLAGTQPDHWTSVPFFGNHAASTDVRLAIEHYDARQNCWAFLGYLPPSAGDTALLLKWPRPGVFKLTPVDFTGEPLEEPKRINIDPEHEALAGPVGHGGRSAYDEDEDAADGTHADGAGGHAAPESMFERLLATERERLAYDRQQIERRETELREREARVNHERNGATGILESRVSDAMKEAMQQQATGYSNILTLQQNMQQAQLAQIEAKANAEVERARIDAAARRDEMNLMLQREQLRMDRERQESLERMAREDAMRKESLAMQQAFLERTMGADRTAYERELDRNKEHARAVLTLIEQKGDPLGQFAGLIGTAKTMAESLGIDVKGIFARPEAPEPAAGGTLTAIIDAAGKVLPGVLSLMAAAASAQADEDEDDVEEVEDDRVPLALPNGVTIMLDREEFAKLEAARANTPAIPGPVGAAPGQPTAPPQPQTYTGPVDVVPMGPDMYASMPGAIPIAPPPGSIPVAPPAAPAQAQVPTPELPAGMTAEQVKLLRAEITRIVSALESQPEAGWAAYIITAVPSVPGLLDYLNAVTVARALVDVAVDPTLLSRVLAACARAGLPASLIGGI